MQYILWIFKLMTKNYKAEFQKVEEVVKIGSVSDILRKFFLRISSSLEFPQQDSENKKRLVF